jgi:mono/diheme cytochrome c family protein
MKQRVCAVTVFVAVVSAVASAQQAAVIERGQQVYTDQKCMICHSIAGQGNKNGSLDGVGSKLSVDEIRSWLVNAEEMTAKTNATRKPVMKSYTSLTNDDLDALVAYMQSLK